MQHEGHEGKLSLLQSACIRSSFVSFVLPFVSFVLSEVVVRCASQLTPRA